jgi:hypothetical protein
MCLRHRSFKLKLICRLAQGESPEAARARPGQSARVRGAQVRADAKGMVFVRCGLWGANEHKESLHVVLRDPATDV